MIYGLGLRLYELRTSRGLSQKDVANLLHVSATLISNYERSERTPSLEVLVSLASLYRCSTDYLLGFEKQKEDKVLDVSMLTDDQFKLLQLFLYELKK